MDKENGPNIFTGQTDVFGGITLSTDEQSWSSSEEFKEMLIDSLEHWKKASKRGVWIIVPLHQADLVGIIAKLGFVFHHAKPDYVMMTRWLPEDEPNMLPGFATHYIGAGGFVLNEKNELLVIQELYGAKQWKLPGGAVEPQEDLPVAVCREVLEETGISAEFESIGCFRHLHQFHFGRSDIYFVCILKPLTSEIKMDPREIAACRWMPIEEYLEHPEVHKGNKYFARRCLASMSKDCKVNLRPERSSERLVYSLLPKPETSAASSKIQSLQSLALAEGESSSCDLASSVLPKLDNPPSLPLKASSTGNDKVSGDLERTSLTNS